MVGGGILQSKSLHATDAANLKLPQMRDTSRHKSAVKETLNSAITLPAVLHKPRLRPELTSTPLRSENWQEGRAFCRLKIKLCLLKRVRK